ncbi:hypothetical protein BT63DRAFT_427148 [Microthyrium microscopicum]|uniref:Uncharacterized protein n=1 Tax=Microthyrium microscopicum TaxID=703497 RepID=A0A6A6U490_9PEZI|nr:hypothetical protein BT63DRAFT_427148 [Microthyrium microscopicum]
MPETRRTSMRLREPAAKQRDEAADSEAPKQSPRGPGKRGRPSKKEKTVTSGAENEQSVKKEEEKPRVVVLPNKLVDGESLPSLPKSQPEDLKDSEWYSVGESGVLTTSLARSKQQWLSDCVFEKFWSKATYKKKKDLPEGTKSTTKDSRPPMTRMGTCKMIVEPHIFDVTIFVIKDTTVPPQPPQQDRQFVGSFGPTNSPSTHSTYQAGSYRPPITPQSTHGNKPLYPTTASSLTPLQQQSKPLSTTPTIYTPVAKPTTASSYSPSPAASSGASNTPQNITSQNQNQNRPTPTAPVARPSPMGPPATAPRQPAPPARPPSAATDPVIQMLAQRAQNDNALKQVMKLVAGNEATPEQLTYFQGHIDELTRIVKDREAAAAEERRKALAAQQHQYTGPRAPYQVGQGANHSISRPFQQPLSYQSPIARAAPTNPIPRPSFQPTPPRPPRQVFVPQPLHVLMEFSQNSTDRFLFPKNTILEYDEKRSKVLASFLVVKKESELFAADTAEGKKRSNEKKKGKEGAQSPNPDAMNLDPKPETKESDGQPVGTTGNSEKIFYQPLTVRFEAPSDPTLLNFFEKVAAPEDQVVKYMTGIAEKAERASANFLALRLPREPKEISIDELDVGNKPNPS